MICSVWEKTRVITQWTWLFAHACLWVFESLCLYCMFVYVCACVCMQGALGCVDALQSGGIVPIVEKVRGLIKNVWSPDISHRPAAPSWDGRDFESSSVMEAVGGVVVMVVVSMYTCTWTQCRLLSVLSKWLARSLKLRSCWKVVSFWVPQFSLLPPFRLKLFSFRYFLW